MAKGKTKHADFVGQIVKDPKSPPETLLLQGFPGVSSEKGHTRLYFDAQLTSYVEIPDEAILHSSEVPDQQSPLGGSYLWIKRDAQLIQGSAGTGRVKAAFLEGPIMAGVPNLQGAGWPGGFPFPTASCPPLPTAICATWQGCQSVLCPTRPWTGCPPPTPFCPTRPPQCLPTPTCPTRPIVCPTHLPQCHTIVDCYTEFRGCKTHSLQCHTVIDCGLQTAMPNCIQTLACPSAVDACPSSFGCGFPGGIPGVNQ